MRRTRPEQPGGPAERVGHSARPARRVAALLVVAATLLTATLATACGQVKDRYVSNHAMGSFFKVPADWKYANLTQSEKEGRPAELPDGIESVWHVAFVGVSSQPAEDSGSLPPDLRGDAQIYRVSNYYRESQSLSDWRKQQFGGVDPLYPPDGLEDRVNLVSYLPITSGAMAGSRLVANLNVAGEGEDPQWVTIDGSTLFDDQKGRVYTLTMKCASNCYLRYRPSADAIATSWKVKQP